MLQDRGLLAQEARGTWSPATSPTRCARAALVASRLDGLSAGERSLLQDASVLGQSFTAARAAAVSGRAEHEVTAVLDRLVAKQVLARDDDPRSPERGQYHFLQALLRTVADGTLSRRARKAHHVNAARHLERTWPGELRDIAEVLPSHYQEAIRADPDADDVAALRAAALETLTAAGRAGVAHARPEAQRYFEQAAEIAEDDLDALGCSRRPDVRCATAAMRPAPSRLSEGRSICSTKRAAYRRVGDGGAGRGDAPGGTPR